MRGRWKVLLLGIALTAPRCSTDPPCSNHSAPHATFDVTRGCVGYYCAMSCDDGFADCNSVEGDGCETPTTSGLPPHTVLDPSASTSGGCGSSGDSIGSIGRCNIVCAPGFFDCDHDQKNGCETSSVIGCFGSFDAAFDATSGPQRIATITYDPRGLVACAGGDYFFDGLYLRSVDTATLIVSDIATSPDAPVGGLACDGTALYWSTTSGSVYSVSTLGGAPQVVASGFDASPGIDVRDGGVFVMSNAGVLVARGDAGLSPWMPATPTDAYKPFALGATDDWSVSGSSILRRSDDAGTTTWVDDAGAPSTVVLSNGSPIASIHASFDDAGPTTDWIARLVDDAGGPASSTIFTTAKPIVATASGAKAVVASDDTIYAVTPQQVTALYITSDHIADVAIDGKWVVWTTRGEIHPAGVFRGPLP